MPKGAKFINIPYCIYVSNS